MREPAAPPNRVGAETTLMWRDDTVVATVLAAFDELWADAQWVAASDRLVIELAVVELITATRGSHRCATSNLALAVDEVQVGAPPGNASTAGLASTEFARRPGLDVQVLHQQTSTGSVTQLTHTLRRPARLLAAGAEVRDEQIVGRLGLVPSLTETSRRSNIRIRRAGVAVPAAVPDPRPLTQPLGQSLGIEPTRSPVRR